jgi:hypothetical protein
VPLRGIEFHVANSVQMSRILSLASILGMRFYVCSNFTQQDAGECLACSSCCGVNSVCALTCIPVSRIKLLANVPPSRFCTNNKFGVYFHVKSNFTQQFFVNVLDTRFSMDTNSSMSLRVLVGYYVNNTRVLRVLRVLRCDDTGPISSIQPECTTRCRQHGAVMAARSNWHSAHRKL